MKKTLFLTAILGAALCSTAWAADTADWTISTNESGQAVFTTTQNGAYDINLGVAAITTGATQPYSITVLTTNTAGWTIPTGGAGNGLIIASTSNGNGNVQNQNNFTIRFGQTDQGVYQGKAWINNWGQYGAQTLTKADGVDTITTLGATVVMDPAKTTGKKLQVFTAEGSQLVGNDKLINDDNMVSQYNYATLSNKGAGLSDYSTVSTTITVTKNNGTVSGVTIGNLTTADTAVTMNNVTMTGKLTATDTGSFTLGGNSNLSGLTPVASELKYGESEAAATATGNGYAFGSYTYDIATAGSNVSLADGATFSNDLFSSVSGSFESSTGQLNITKSAGAGVYVINQGGTIAYTTDSAIASAATTGIVVNAAATLNMGTGTTLANLTAKATTKIDGSGLYIAGSATTLGDNVSLADSWNGTVQLTGALDTNADFLATAAKNGSTVEMKGVSKWTSNWDKTVSQDIKLTNNGGTAAWTYGAYYTDNSKQYNTATTFSGDWSGDGNFMTAVNDGKGMRYIYTGDISQWTGTFKMSANNANSVGIVQFGGDATEVNAVIQRDSGILKVVVDTDATFSKNITNAALLTINANKSATMKQNLTIDSVVMADGSSLNFCTTGSNKNLRLNAASTLNNLTVQDFDFKQFDSKEEAAAGAYTVTLSGTNEVKGLLDMSRSAQTGASLLVKADSSLTHKGDNFWMCSTNTGILLEEDAIFTRKELFTVKGLSSVEGSRGHIAWTNTANDGTFNNLNQSSVTISNAELTVTSNQTISTGLSNVALKTGTNTITLNTDATLTGLDFGKALTINSGKTVTVNGTANYTGETTTREVALTTGNGYGTVETYAHVINGAGSVAGTTTWTHNGQAATYSNGDIITGSTTSTVYYVNNATADIAVKTGDTYVINTASALTVTDGTLDYDKITTPGKTNVSSIALSGDTTGFKKGIFSLTGDGATLTPASGQVFDINQTGATVSGGNAAITNAGNYDTTLYNKLSDVNLTYTNTVENKTLMLKNENTLGDVSVGNNAALKIEGSKTTISGTAALNDVTVDSDAALEVNAAKFSQTEGSTTTVNGDLTFVGAPEEGVALNALVLGAGATVTVGTKGEHDHNLAVDSLTLVDKGEAGYQATINANLDLTGATMTRNYGEITLGCELTMDGTTISINDDEGISILYGIDGGLTLFNSVETLTLGSIGSYDTPMSIALSDANITLAGAGAERLQGQPVVYLDFNADNTVKLSLIAHNDIVPEPATATLSLLALAALAARRRRH